MLTIWSLSVAIILARHLRGKLSGKLREFSEISCQNPGRFRKTAGMKETEQYAGLPARLGCGRHICYDYFTCFLNIHVCIVRSFVCAVHFRNVNTITALKWVTGEVQTYRTCKTKTNTISGCVESHITISCRTVNP